jgi:hypothetical protein
LNKSENKISVNNNEMINVSQGRNETLTPTIRERRAGISATQLSDDFVLIKCGNIVIFKMAGDRLTKQLSQLSITGVMV